MKEYLIAMIGACAVSFLVKQLGLFGDNKYVGFVCGLCAIAIAVSPLCRLAEWIEEFDFEMILEDDGENHEEYSKYFDSYLTDTYIRETVAQIESVILEEYGLSEDEVRVSLYRGDGEEIYVFVALTGKGIFADTSKMEARLRSLYGCEVQIVIGR